MMHVPLRALRSSHDLMAMMMIITMRWDEMLMHSNVCIKSC